MEKRQQFSLDYFKTSSSEKGLRWDDVQSKILDAADALIMKRGMESVTIAALSRQAGFSRPTIYRTWKDADDVLRSALLRRIVRLIEKFPEPTHTRLALVEDILRFTSLLRADDLYRGLLEQEPEIFSRYVLQRVGESQRLLLGWLAERISQAQSDPSMREENPERIATMIMLITQAALLSHGTVADLIDEKEWRQEMRIALSGYLRTEKVT